MTTDTVTDAQVFEAMGWEQCGEGHWYNRAASSKCDDYPLPPVMSNPSSPEAWEAVPLMLGWFSDEILSGRLSHAELGHEDGTEWFFGVWAGPHFDDAAVDGGDGEMLAYPVVVAAELPAAIGRALVEAKRG